VTNLSLRVGSRMSALAMWQTKRVISLLESAWPDVTCQIIPYNTKGDSTLDKALPAIGGKGLFTAELEVALRDGVIDLAVHSLKDLPVENAPGTLLGAISERADVRDCLVARNGWTLEMLPQGAVVGTSSTRRQAQLLSLRPDLIVRSIRGKVETRIRKVLEDELYHATVLAAAGVQRLEKESVVSEWLAVEVMLPAPGQGAMAVQCREDDDSTRSLLSAVHSRETAAAVTAERAFLSSLGGGCSAPVAAYARLDGERLVMQGLVGSIDGSRLIRAEGTDADPHVLGASLGARVMENGARELLGHG
jgi:hydroxymethylbilane synthase